MCVICEMQSGVGPRGEKATVTLSGHEWILLTTTMSVMSHCAAAAVGNRQRDMEELVELGVNNLLSRATPGIIQGIQNKILESLNPEQQKMLMMVDPDEKESYGSAIKRTSEVRELKELFDVRDERSTCPLRPANQGTAGQEEHLHGTSSEDLVTGEQEVPGQRGGGAQREMFQPGGHAGNTDNHDDGVGEAVP